MELGMNEKENLDMRARGIICAFFVPRAALKSTLDVTYSRSESI